ncbi:fused MFS/spermidine synthase [Candidatus Microgenomates bacterium]|nr:fused MFS/spermidine synthase [Candidatus Microgenomates bacterium]
MKKSTLRLLPLFFFLSGFAGLVYEVVWTRQLLLIFGSTTHSVVAVLAAFMAGLAIGSFLIGQISDKTRQHLKLYGLLEIMVGVSTLATIILFPAIQIVYQWLFSFFGFNAYLLLLAKFLLIGLVLLPPTIAMGGTLPLLVRFLINFSPHVSKAVSYLYAVNTFGAVAGVLLTGFVFIELLGLRFSLILAALLNLGIGLASVYLSKRSYHAASAIEKKASKLLKIPKIKLSRSAFSIVIIAFALSGFVSLAYEVLWTRLLTPSVGTYIYAFSGILGVYLLGLALGSLLYRFVLHKLGSPFFLFGFIEIGIGLSALLSVIANSSLTSFPAAVKVLTTIIPGTLLMGMSFPVVMRILQGHTEVGKGVGVVYSANTLGTIMGSLAAAFILIPIFGTVRSIFVLTLINFSLGILLVLLEKKLALLFRRSIIAFSIIIILVTGSFLFQPSLLFQEGKLKERITSLRGDYEVLFLEDEVASVLGYRQKEGGDRALIIDGVQTTSLGPETALLAHLPLFMRPQAEDMLVIAFGMGSTYRSALLHDNVRVDAVDLVPSVPKMFNLFHDDASLALSNPRGKIIINDGRNYVRMTDKKYDIIVVDPPPPVNAAGTTVLYSKEFYEDSKKKLKDDGIFVAWFYSGTRMDDFQILLRSFYEVFPHILIMTSPQGWGYYVFGSDRDITWDKKMMEEKYHQYPFYDDINETRINPLYKSRWGPVSFKEMDKGVLGDESFVKNLVKDVLPVTDDRPRTEYFLIRQKRNFQERADIEEWIEGRK